MSFNQLDLCVIKSLINNKKHALDFVNECDTNLFSPDIWNAAKLITGYVKTYKEAPTINVILDKLSKGNNDKLIEHVKQVWLELDSVKSDDKEYQYNVDKLKKRFAEKQISQLKDSLNKIDPGNVDVNKTVTDIQKSIQTIKSLNKQKTFENYSIKDYLPTFVEKFNAKRENPNIEAGLMTKYSFFDFATNGVKPADMILIAGESGFGKSLLLNNIAIQTWMQDNNVNMQSDFGPGKDIAYFSLEMPYEDCFNRLISRLSGVPSRDIENAKLSKEDFAKVKKALDFINKYPYNFRIIDIVDACANDIENILIDGGEKFDALFIDYLGIMNPNEKSDEADWLKQGIVSYEVRAIARKHRIPLFSAVQLNRKKDSKDSAENIGLSRLARSGTIATHATHVIQIENRQNEEKYPDFLYHFIKNRKGPKGKGTLYKNLACATLIDKPMEKDANYDNMFIDQDDISGEIEKLELEL